MATQFVLRWLGGWAVIIIVNKSELESSCLLAVTAESRKNHSVHYSSSFFVGVGTDFFSLRSGVWAIA
jgi:hypothetical protein